MNTPRLTFASCRVPLAIVAILLAVFEVAAGAQGSGLKKGDIVTVVVPLRVIQDDADASEARLNGARVSVTHRPDGALLLDGRDNWRTAGLPLMKRGTVNSVINNKTEKLVSVGWDEFFVIFDLSPSVNPTDIVGKLVFMGDPATEQAQRYESEVRSLLADAFFLNEAALDPAVRRRLLGLALDVGAQRLSIEKHNGGDHVVFDMGRDPSVFNTLRLDAPTRTAEAIRRNVIAVLKAAGKFDWPASIMGVKVVVAARHKNTLKDADAPSIDTVIVFTPLAHTRRFAEAGISSQQLIDASVVLVNDARVQVSLR